jgi:ParB family transcriptional regulator, chromosome partitioning protein
MMIQVQEIPLGAVDRDAPLIHEGPRVVPERLLDSLRDVGLLTPIWLRARGQEVYQVVTGRRRLQAAAALQWREIAAQVLPPDTPESRCLLLHLYDNAFARGFELPEQAVLAAELLKYWDRQEVAGRFLPYLGLPPSPAHLERLLKMGQLEAPFQELAGRGRLALTAAAQLHDWDPGDRAAALPFLTALHLSQSKQEEFLEQVQQLSRREGVTAAAVLARPELAQPLADPASNPQEKTAAVRRQLSLWVYPRFSKTLEAYERALGCLGWKNHPRVRLQPPAAFEGPDFHLEIKFRDAPELQQLLAEILELSRRGDFTDLTRL